MSTCVIFSLHIIRDNEAGDTFACVDDNENAESLFVPGTKDEIECVLEAAKLLTQIAVKKQVREAIEEERLLNE